MMWWDHNDWGFGNWLAMGLTMLIFWSLVIGLIVWAVRSVSSNPAGSAGDRLREASPADVLAARFARGDISEDEFTRRRALLHGTPSAPGGRGE